jgi:hypothetical protein
MKPRNHIVLAMIRSSKQSVVHMKSKKAIRQQDKIDLKKDKNRDTE